MRQFDNNELETFLRAVDSQLSGLAEIVVIGGAAAAMAYQSDFGTHDIDTATNVSQIEEALAAARKVSGIDVGRSHGSAL